MVGRPTPTVATLKVARHVQRGESPSAANFELTDSTPAAALAEGCVRLRLTHLSIDPWYLGLIMPGLYGWCDAIPEGKTFTGTAVAVVAESKHADYKVGECVTSFLPFQTDVVSDGAGLTKLGATTPVDALSIFGGPALTAFFGLEDVARPKQGEAVVISAAAGSVGSIVGQLCKARGCKVIGFAGSPSKCKLLTEELGFDAAIDYKNSANLAAELAAVLGDAAVDVFWDNTSGPVATAVYAAMAAHGRVVLCGNIASYTSGGGGGGGSGLEERNHLILEKRLRVEGILVSEFFARMGEAMPTLLKLHATGQLRARAHVVHGFENTVDAFLGLFAGTNTGKTIVALTE